MSIRWKIAQWFELNWWKTYLKNKDKETYLTWKQEYWKMVLEKLVPEVDVKPEQTVFDLGCGPAGVFIVLKSCDVLAVDPLIDAYEKELPFFKKMDYPWVRFRCTSLENFENETGAVTVFCMNAINHVKDMEIAFDKLCKAVKVGGKLVVSFDTHNHGLFKYLFRMVPGDILHPHQFDLNEYIAFLEKRDFVVAKQVNLKHEFFFDHHVLVAVRK